MSIRALLDTHSFIWFVSGSGRLSALARTVVEEPDNTLLISVASLWEIAIKTALGKLSFDRPFAELLPEELARQQIGILDMKLAHLIALVQLPQHHRDPFDRLIAAQALAENLPVISVDPALDAYGVQRLW